MIDDDAKAERPWWSFGCIGHMTRTDIRNLGRFNLWMLGWAVAWLTALLVLRAVELAPVARFAVALVPAGVALRAIQAYVRFLRQADELMRRIHVEAIGFGFGAGFVLATSWRLLERAGAPPLEVTWIGTTMIAGWAVGQALGRRRYA